MRPIRLKPLVISLRQAIALVLIAGGLAGHTGAQAADSADNTWGQLAPRALTPEEMGSDDTGPVSSLKDNGNAATLDRLMAAKPDKPRIRLSPVREAALRVTARTLGTQTGLIERAKEIAKEVDKRRVQMEAAFRFGDLVIGAGVLPPVLLHTENAASVKSDTMRLAGAVYQIKQPARFFSGAPSWRDWLLLGLPVKSQMPKVPDRDELLPRDSNERAFWEQEVKSAYLSGRAQAQEIFEHNLSMLEEVYTGMRTFYNLYQRNMVSAPVIAKSQEIITRDDPNTIVVGDTLFRITLPAQFQMNPDKWRALQATPAAQTPLPAVAGFDPVQVREAYQIYQAERAQHDAEREGKKVTVVEKAGPPPSPSTQAGVVATPAGAPATPIAPIQIGSVDPNYASGPAIQSESSARSAPASPPAAPAMLSTSRPLFAMPSTR